MSPSSGHVLATSFRTKSLFSKSHHQAKHQPWKRSLESPTWERKESLSKLFVTLEILAMLSLLIKLIHSTFWIWRPPPSWASSRSPVSPPTCTPSTLITLYLLALARRLTTTEPFSGFKYLSLMPLTLKIRSFSTRRPLRRTRILGPPAMSRSTFRPFAISRLVMRLALSLCQFESPHGTKGPSVILMGSTSMMCHATAALSCA
mmetsp:Transcript_19892/g.33015  ORF Transcript_19892/g.33015 Transcript_19892/m.33015 type:complete len:204 (+) Transcript_19892:1961-2572(+)